MNENNLKFQCIILVNLFILFDAVVGSQASKTDQCNYKKFRHAKVGWESTQTRLPLLSNTTDALQQCDMRESCLAISGMREKLMTLHEGEEHKGSLEHVDDSSSFLMMKLCPDASDFKLMQIPGGPAYYEPVKQGSSVSVMKSSQTIILKQAFPDHTITGLKPTGTLTSSTAKSSGFSIKIHELPLQDGITTERSFDSWCTKRVCSLSPRSYYHPVSPEFSIIGFTDINGQGNIILLNKNKVPYSYFQTLVNGTMASVAGVYGFYDWSFAAALFVNSGNPRQTKMYLQLYRNDMSVEWTTLLNSAITVPDRNVGDSRLTYGDEYFLVYFSVFGIDNFANNTNGEQLSFVDSRGNLKTTSFTIPGQEFVTRSDLWGCSHSLGQLADYHSEENQFITVCNADLFPKGISLGDATDGTVLYRADGNGRGHTNAQLGQIAQSRFGFKLIFNAEKSCTSLSCECCPGKGIGFISIYNEKDELTGQQGFEPVVWITASNGSDERDPVMARISLGSHSYSSRERYLIGWFNQDLNDYFLAIVNMFGSLLQNPVSFSNISFNFQNTTKCEKNCVIWGNRDDSFKTLPDGSAGWVYVPPDSSSIWLYEAHYGGNEVVGWSLWSGWTLCSVSCGGGVTKRKRWCLSENCISNQQIEVSKCNTEKCKIPLTCSFKYANEYSLEGDLYINGVRQFAFTLISAQEKCKELIEVCRGLTRAPSGKFQFYFLKTSSILKPSSGRVSATMSCIESPGWSKWGNWFACSRLCGSGERIRRRFCDGNEPGSDVCLGEQEQSQSCNTGRCPAWSEWSNWDECSETCDEGIQVRRRRCVGDYPKQCKMLSGHLIEERVCSLGECPQWSSWQSWSACSASCGDGLQKRTRECKGDFACPTDDKLNNTDTRSCNLRVCLYWAQWSMWSECAASCDASFRVRSRTCVDKSASACALLGSPKQTEICNLGECPHWGLWKTWSKCSLSCGTGIQIRSRDCLGDFPVESCTPGVPMESKGCSLGECAWLGEWANWGRCSASCGDGIQTRSRECKGDFDCPDNEPLFANKICNLGTCPSWSRWNTWGPCSVTCGRQGQRSRIRQCLGDFPDLCTEDGDTDVGKCETLPDCPRWQKWSEWSGCSETCGYGSVQRRRKCSADNLESCNTSETDIENVQNVNITLKRDILGYFVQTESRDCSYGLCSYWLDWNTWSECSATCDKGLRMRSRKCFGEFHSMCLGSYTQEEICSIGKCGSWGRWQSWGPCSRTCGEGVWSRVRKCLGDFKETCIGSSTQTTSCDINDCVSECASQPCKNGGSCRANTHLTRLYSCDCLSGWMGKHCDYVRPGLTCGSNNIIITFDRKVVSDEGLIASDPSLVSLVSSDSSSCSAFFDYINNTSYYVVIAPSPLDTACGSTMKITPLSYQIRNQVIWQIEDTLIRSRVILVDFTCIYLRDAQVSSSSSSVGNISIETFKRRVEVATSSGVFDVDISLFRDSSYQRKIFSPDPKSLVSLMEGDVVFVSVDLRSRDILPSDDAVLVMDTCFVTSSQSTREPLLYLIKESCPVSLFVSILSNGMARFGRFSVRVFGWTGRAMRIDDVFIHCTVSVCNSDEEACSPSCESRSRRKRSTNSVNNHSSSSITSQTALFLARTQQRTNDLTLSQVSRSSNGHPYVRIAQVVPPNSDGNAELNLTRSLTHLDFERMVSAGPFTILVKTSRRSARDIKLGNSNKMKLSLFLYYLVLFCHLAIAWYIS